MASAIVFLTGASGAGKTSIVRALRVRDPEGIYLHFDSIGVPDHETMVREFGSGERWHAETTRRWIAKIVVEHADRPLVLLEGQVRPSFVETAFAEHGIARTAVILIDCDDEQREARLRARGQPELANETMRSWAAFLLQDARQRKLLVIDTTTTAILGAATAVADLGRGFLLGNGTWT